MAYLSFGFMVLLLTYSKIVSANALPTQDELTEKLNLNGEKDSTYTGTPSSIIEKTNILPSVEQNEDLNKFTKPSIDYRSNRSGQDYRPRGNWLNNNNYYNPQSRDKVAPDSYSLFSQRQLLSHPTDRPHYIPSPPIEYKPSEGYLSPDNKTPLFSNISTYTVANKFDLEGQQTFLKLASIRIPGLRSTTPHSLIHNVNDVDSKNELPEITPAAMTTTTISTPKPASTKLPPSSCVWSIISCCNSNSRDINYRCFEQLGCAGVFWDRSPCDAQYTREAIETIMKYYETK